MQSAPKKTALGTGLFGNQSQLHDEVYLNVTPLMDVMTNLLFFLLAAFGASAVTMFATGVPVAASYDSSIHRLPDETPTVTLRADATGLTLACGNVPVPELAACHQQIKKVAGTYDTGALGQALKSIKIRYPKADTLVVIPDDDVPYHVIVTLLDAARDEIHPPGRRIDLFNNVVMSSLVQ